MLTVKARLDRLGVVVMDSARLRLQCKTCGRVWKPRIPAGGRYLRKGYWKCEAGCNAAADWQAACRSQKATVPA